MSHTVCIDIGGTFTDCVVADAAGGLGIFKAPTTPGRFEQGFMDALGLAATHYGSDLRAFLGACDRIVHGTTVSTNALVERKTVSTGFLCNAGHPDILTLREAPRKRCFDFRLDYPKPYVPRTHTAEVGGRIDAFGGEVEPLDEGDVRRAVEMLRKRGVEAIAVCFLWSTVNPDHELRTREIVRAAWPGVPITLSHELNPIPREYRRAISAVIDASLHPIVSAYTEALQGALADQGFDTDHFLVATCTGGMMPPAAVVEKPIYSVMSGPTLAPVAAQYLSSTPDVVVVDMGGTTFDVAAIRDGRLIVNAEAMIGDDMLGIPKVDVRSVGAGGGSIASVDVAGMIQVGPESAGARPGPACYGLGGSKPTVTDANVVLGLIDPDDFLGGRMKLDRSAAEAAVADLGNELGLGPIEAAQTIHTASNHNMIAAIEDITVMEGINPRDSFLVAGGGAIGCHIGAIAAELGIKRYMVPRFAAGLSAFGGLISNIRWEEAATLFTIADAFALDGVNAALARMREAGEAFLDRAGVARVDQRFDYVFYGRYEFQSWEIEVPFTPTDGRLAEGDVSALATAFHQMHQRIYSVKDEDDRVEFVTWKVRAVGLVERPAEDGTAPAPSAAPSVEGYRRIVLDPAAGPIDVPIHRAASIHPGAAIAGPAVIADETTTIIIHPRSTAIADTRGDFVVTMD
jgi:N-methylhydantoinase A